MIGNSTNKALITTWGQLTPSGSTDLAIGKLTINGRVEYGLIVAGSSDAISATSSNADAQIGPVVIGGDWIASSLVAGAAPGVDGQYGNADDVKMSGGSVKDVATVFSKITSIVIGGQVMTPRPRGRPLRLRCGEHRELRGQGRHDDLFPDLFRLVTSEDSPA